jgi:hypothetical protein
MLRSIIRAFAVIGLLGMAATFSTAATHPLPAPFSSCSPQQAR